MKAIGDNKRLPISDTESRMDSEVPTPEVGRRDRRSFLIAVGRTAKALAAAHVLRGQINPTVQVRPGELQFWRIGHVGATLLIKFRIEGMPLYVVATDDGPGVLKVVIPFTDPVIVGRFVYHCHSVNHEDKGMMGIVEVVA
jgi:FtsP/CotA-like multicopper oxidase with cupredoxin domain